MKDKEPPWGLQLLQETALDHREDWHFATRSHYRGETSALACQIQEMFQGNAAGVSLKANALLVALPCPPQQLAWPCSERQSSGYFPSSSSSRSPSSMAFLEDCHALIPRVQVIPWEKVMSTRGQGQGLNPSLTNTGDVILDSSGVLSHKGIMTSTWRGG